MFIYWYLAASGLLSASFSFYRAGKGTVVKRYTARDSMVTALVQVAFVALWVWLATK